MTTDEKLIKRLDEMLPDKLGTQCNLYSLFDQYSERKCKEFYLWCFLNGEKINKLNGYYNIEQRIQKMYILWQEETEQG